MAAEQPDVAKRASVTLEKVERGEVDEVVRGRRRHPTVPRSRL